MQHDRILGSPTHQLHERHDELFASLTEIHHAPERREQIRRELAFVAFELEQRCHAEVSGE
ncbi:hypothetical protein [Arthrobacter sp. Hiyo1]|uniref:hypothetical protein n=1 Tax=Arthrobacter sp. Hiyo1 TaxID=1588020 RepID=UPI000750E71D|nr:hypothetical protein [Arthrobacter sp. Hiyo1]